MPDGSARLEAKRSYPQKWATYNAAQTGEKAQFLELLHALVSDIEEPAQTKGRPRLPIKDALFAVCFKIYSTVSARRFMSDLQDAQEKGYIGKTPHFNSIFNYLEREELTPILKNLIVESSLPLQAVEQDFAADSSGFTVSKYDRWFDHKHGVKKLRQWVKVHLMCGVKTNIVTAVEIKEKYSGDSRFLPTLLDTTAKNFSLREVSADKGYISAYNLDCVVDKMAIPYIPFKSTHNAKWKIGGRKKVIWQKMYHFFKFHQEEFLEHYHKRSNVETTFSMIKAKFGGYVRSKGEVAQVNECLCKIICHNICVLIQESHELGIDVSFS